MSFWDNVKKFTQPYADDDYDEYEDDEEVVDDYDEEPESTSRYSRRGSASETADREDTGFGFDTGSAFAAPAATSASSPASGGFTGQVVNMNTTGKQQVVLFRPVTFDDSAKAANDLRNKKAVIVNMENVDKAMARRVVDFLSGCVYVMDGKVKKVAQSTYLFCPHNVDVTGDLENLQSEVESYI